MTVQYHQGRFPPENLDWPRLLPLIGPANAAVACYEGVLHGIPGASGGRCARASFARRVPPQHSETNQWVVKCARAFSRVESESGAPRRCGANGVRAVVVRGADLLDWTERQRRHEATMISTTTLDELARRIGRAIEASPAKDIEKNVKALLQGGLAKLDVVPRAEFDVQAKVLARTREKLEILEAKVAELEAKQRGG